MKLKKILIPFSFILSTLYLFSCGPNEPGDPPELVPIPGYQHDIPWPSLADSPCPMQNATPQRISWLNGNIPTSFDVNWVIDTLNISSGIVADNNENIYFPSPPYLYSISKEGKINWKLKLGVYSNITPIITSSNEIIVYFQSPSKITSVSTNGTINWELELNFNLTSQINIGKMGELYFISKNTFYIVKDSQIVSSMHDIRIANLFSISIDGYYAYIVSNSSSILALNLTTNSIEWEIGKGRNMSPPIVNSSGNIYFSSVIENFNNGNPALFCVTPDAEILWFFPHSQYSKSGLPVEFTYPAGTLDKYGNYCFGSDTLYSVSYDGKLNWKYVPDRSIGSYIISDENQNTLFLKDNGNSFGILVISMKGQVIFESQSNYLVGNSTRYHGIILDNRLIIPTQDKFLYSIGGL